ncbi:MAG TPA: hypothetical protein DCR14_09755 [Acidimicrobiaceae bacterium]|nr:hypothetical protein [Acidimicrobiaceae bacterium]
MHLRPIINAVESALTAQGAVAGGDPAVEEAIEHLVRATGPALRQAALDLAEQAAAEVRAQLADRTVDVVLVDGEPSLRITDAPPSSDPSNEDLDARITLRITPSLKSLVEDAAEAAGASVNGWVLDALSKRANKASGNRGFRTTDSFDL